MKNHKKLGEIGEAFAYEFLKETNYKILEKNYKNKIGEIDIIALDTQANTLVFVEVKYRTSLKFGYPREAIDLKKQNKIKNTAILYLKLKNLYDKISVRFDCIELLYVDSTKKPIINHIKNIF